MAGGASSGSVGASLEHARLRQRPNRFSWKEESAPQTECFQRRRKIEQQRIQLKSFKTLEIDIFRLFTEELHCDLLIIHGRNVVETHGCIVRSRSPKLYEILAKSFVHSGETIKCYIELPLIFHRIRHFARLLYRNLDIEEEEGQLVRLCRDSLRAEESRILNSRQRRCESVSYSSFDGIEGGEKRDDGADRVNSTSASEMADSGLETGSLSPLENTESSVTDLEESHAGTDYVSMDDDFISVDPNGEIDETREYKKRSCESPARRAEEKNPVSSSPRAGCSFLRLEQPDSDYRHQEYSYGTENSSVASKKNPITPENSFEFIDPRLNRREDVTCEFKIEKKKDESRSMTLQELEREFSNENLNKSCSGISNYYFIDASSLNDDNEENNDDEDVVIGDEKIVGKKLHNINEDRKIKVQKETIIVEPRPAVSKEKKFENLGQVIEKEALVVEIKEADSGESNQPSPSSDNNSKRSNNSLKPSSNNSNESSKIEESSKNPAKEETNLPGDKGCTETDPEDRRASLVRRNTFELDPNDEKLSLLRQEYERRQGHLIFQNSIPQYSGHRVDGDSCFSLPNERDSTPPVIISRPWTEQTHSRPEMDYTSDWLLVQDSSSERNEEKRESEKDLPCQESPEEIPSSRSSERDSRLGNDRDWMNLPKNSNEYPGEKLLTDSCSESEDGSRNCCNSLPITLSERVKSPRERRSSINWARERAKRDETTPILSGGVSSADHTKPPESPVVRRKTESTPIVSGGSVAYVNETNSTSSDSKPIRMASSMTTAWVVDMSDCGKNNNSTTKTGNGASTAMSKSFSTSYDCVANKINGRESSDASDTKHGSLGFFVNLNDIEDGNESRDKKEIPRKQIPVETGKQSCEFFVDISNGSGKSGEKPKIDGKKNIFSMFIDFKSPTANRRSDEETASVKSEEKRAESKSSWCGKVGSGDQSGESSSSSRIEQSGIESCSSERGKSSVFMFIESDSPVVRRRALSSSKPAFQRHSWNFVERTSPGSLKKEYPVKREHKRAHSVSVDRADLRKLQGKSSNSSHSLSEVARADYLENGDALPKRVNDQGGSSRNTDTSTEEVFEYDVRDTPPNSHVEIDEELLKEPLGHQCYKEEDEEREDKPESESAQQRKLGETNRESKIYEDECSELSAWEKTGTESTTDGGNTRKSETFDISTGGSGASPESGDNFTIEDLPNGREIHYEETRIRDTSEDRLSLFESNSQSKKFIPEIPGERTLKMNQPEIKRSDQFLSRSIDSRIKSLGKSQGSSEDTMRSSCRASFVRLSDLDKTPLRSRESDPPVREDRMLTRMSNSIPETSWVESKLAVNRTDPPVKTLTRKFTSIMSTSLPAKHKSPIEDVTECEGEALISESDLSSMQSSMGRSGADGSTEETETSSMGVTKPYNRLGEDLLRMFLEEINPDVTIDVSGRKIRAHKCILSSRCQYFAAILSGGWIESAGNVITLQGYSYNAVHFALCHIYSGESNIPETLSIVELATLADMLCLEGLKEVIGYTLKVKYCHLFHKPCQVCAVGVLECMPIAAAYGLDEVYRKSLRWITRHFVRIWPCKAFATLPKVLMDKCYHQHIVHMSTDNVLQTMMDCDKLLATLPNVRWAEPVFRMVSNLLETSVKFISDNFSGVLGNENFQALGRDLTWNISRLEDNFLAAADRLSPDQACKSYAKLNKMLSSIAQGQQTLQTKPPPWGPLFIEFLHKIQTRVEKCLVKEASRAARTTTWLKMDLELRRRIQELACLVILPHETLKRPSRHSNFVKEPRVPPTRAPAARSLDLRRVKMAISDQNDKKTNKRSSSAAGTTSAPVTAQQVKRPVLVKPKSDPLERKNPLEEKQATTSDPVAPRPKSWPNKLEVKSRYLEPRNKPVAKESVQQASQHDRVVIQQRRKIIISSSDSSRTSSPAMKRAIDKKPIVKTKLSIKKQDVKALSSDSLAERASSPRSGGKKDSTTSKSCGITRPESPSLQQGDLEIGLSVDSLAESQKKKEAPQIQAGPGKKKPVSSKMMDTSMSTDSLMAEIASVSAPKSLNPSNKVSPTMARTAPTTRAQIYDRTKKSSPPMQLKNQSTMGRRLPRSLECSTAASRSRAAAISAYHGSPNLRRNLLEAAKTPDVPGKTSVNGLVPKSNVTSQTKREKHILSNQGSTESPSKRSSPKSNGGAHRTSRVTGAPGKRPTKGVEDRTKLKCHNGEAAKQPTVGSRSGTFLKDEPTILKKSDVKTAQISGS